MTQILTLMRPAGVFWNLVEAHDDWTIRFHAPKRVVFGQMLEGRATVLREDGMQVDIAKGDFLLMIDPGHWRMSGGSGGAPVGYAAVTACPVLLLSERDSPDVARFMAGNFAFGGDTGPLRLLELPVVVVRARDGANRRIGGLLCDLDDEIARERPARGFAIDRLLELILVEALRHGGGGATVRPGLVAALADAKVGQALKLIHADVRRTWTVAALAREVGLSRSAFASRFARIVGTAPIDYIARWRIMLAKNALANPQLSMDDIAHRIGFRSASAFSTAFKRIAGQPPAAFRRGLAGSVAPDEGS